jgi:hypothetical protein
MDTVSFKESPEQKSYLDVEKLGLGGLQLCNLNIIKFFAIKG